jgi:hypothetical protein
MLRFLVSMCNGMVALANGRMGWSSVQSAGVGGIGLSMGGRRGTRTAFDLFDRPGETPLTSSCLLPMLLDLEPAGGGPGGGPGKGMPGSHPRFLELERECD